MFSGEDIVAFDYHAATDRYVICTDGRVNYKLPEDELHPEWAYERTEIGSFTRSKLISEQKLNYLLNLSRGRSKSSHLQVEQSLTRKHLVTEPRRC